MPIGKPLASPSTCWDDAIDWRVVGDEALELLLTYLRFPTVNDPDRLSADAVEQTPWCAGREEDAARWLGGVLRAEGIACELLESAPGRVNVVARLQGSGSASAVTLLSHSDVVPVVASEWDVDPFGGLVRQGYVYGRGALDLKGLGVAQAFALILMHRLRIPLRRDVVLVVAADEEAGGRYGAEWLLRQRPELLSTATVLGEGGLSPTGLLGDTRLVHAIAVAEKGCLEIELTAEGTAHHASLPTPDDAPTRLLAALHNLIAARPRIRMTPAASALFDGLSAKSSGVHRFLFRHPRLAARLGFVAARPFLAAMVTDTIAVTLLESGYKSNIVPGQARAVLNLRLLPGEGPEVVLAGIQRVIGDHSVTMRQLMYKPPTSSSFDTPEFGALARCAAELDPTSLTTPVLSPAASDCRFWRAAGVDCYGWVPFVLPAADLHGIHGPNERVSIKSFCSGIRALYRAVADMAASEQ
jgi:acetylornithine deacetylase/succinyl-diaminopimelate desuccinylase-like protein